MRLIIVFFMLISPVKPQELRGHGGPVKVLTFNEGLLASGSFDQSIILWDLKQGKARHVLRAHEGAITALLSHGETLLSGGEDGRVIEWKNGVVHRTHKAHEAQVSAIAINGKIFASSGWDGAVTIFGESMVTVKTASEKLIGLGFKQNGDILTVSSEGDIYRFSDKGKILEVVKTKSQVMSMLLLKNDTLILGLSHGAIKIAGQGEVTLASAPIIALAVNEDQSLLAVASIAGTVTLYDLKSGKVLHSLSGPGLPVWSVMIMGDEIITGGGDRLVRRWDVKTGEHKGAIINENSPIMKANVTGDRGAEVFRACAVCHSLTPDHDNKAGPSLHRIIDAKVASKVNYNYSEVLLKNSTIWTEINIKKLFEIGPNSFFPGTKMPEQRITTESDRQALVDFLKKNTK